MERGGYQQNRGYQEKGDSRHHRHKHSRSRSQEHRSKGSYNQQQDKYSQPYQSQQKEERRQSRFGKQDTQQQYGGRNDAHQGMDNYFQEQQQGSRFSQRQERFQDRGGREMNQESRDMNYGGGRDMNQGQQRFQKFPDQQDNYQQRRQGGQGGQQYQNRGGQRGGFNNRGKQQRNQQQQQQQQQQPPQKLYYYEQLQQQSQQFLSTFETQQGMPQQMIQPISQDQQQQQQSQQESGMIENLNEIEKLKNEYDPQKSQEQLKEKIQDTTNYKWDEWENEVSAEAIKTMDIELEKLLGKRMKARVPPDISSNMADIKIQITKTDEMPELEQEFKISEKQEEIVQLIEEISPYQQQFENLTSLLINEFELIDMYRKPELSLKRYSVPIVNYSQGGSKLGQIFSRDYFKLWELLTRFKLLEQFEGKPLQIANLSEGAGGFINCLVDYRNRQQRRIWNQDQYVAMTMKNKDKKNQQIYDWDFFKTKKYMAGLDQQNYTIKLSYGASQDGDMLNTQNLIFFINYELKDKITNQLKKCQIVTANGGTEFSIFNNQSHLEELENAKLFFAEVITALSIQEKGGFFIMKIFNTQFEITRNILALLAKYYKKVYLVKPFISNPVSNERYIVCDDFIGIDSNVNEKLLGVLQEWMESENSFDYQSSEMFINKFLEFDKNNASKFIENLKKSNEEIMTAQIQKLKQALSLLKNPVTPDIIKNIKQTQFESAKKWCIKFEIPYLFNLDMA